MAAPKERLTQLLSSKDKRATLLEMAGESVRQPSGTNTQLIIKFAAVSMPKCFKNHTSLLKYADAGGGQLDDALLKLLQQNIDAARAAGQEDPAQFMEKIRDAAKRFTLKT